MTSKINDKYEEYKFFTDKDLDRITNNYMTSIFDKILQKYKIDKVLDYGCGNGIFGSYFKNKSQCSLAGVDGSKYALKKAEELGYDNVYHVSDFCAQRIPIDDESVDFVLAKDVLEHMIDPTFVLNEIYRVCSKGGLLLLHVPNHFPIIYRWKFLFTNNIDTQNYFPDATDWDFPHIRFIKYKSIVNKLESMGFCMVDDFSEKFAAYIPKTSKIPVLNSFQKFLAKRYPEQFSKGSTLLWKKI